MKRGELFRRRIRHIRRVAGYETGLFATAWLYLTRIPLPPAMLAHVSHQQSTPVESIRYVPLVGLLVGALAGGVFLGANELFESKPLGILLSIATSVLVASRAQPGNILTVLINFQALVLIPAELIPSVLIAANAFSRFAAAAFIGTHPLVQPDQHGQYHPVSHSKVGRRDFVVLAILGVVPLLLIGNLLFLLLTPLLWVIRNLFGAWFIGRIGGYTNEYLNLTQQLIECSCYLLVVSTFRHRLGAS